MKKISKNIIKIACTLAITSSSSAATFTWDGDTSGDWNQATNWDTTPTFDNVADIKIAGEVELDQFVRTNRKIRSLEFTSTNIGLTTISLIAGNGTSARNIIFDTDSITDPATLTIDVLSSGVKTFDDAGQIQLVDSLDIFHNGADNLVFDSAITGAGRLTLFGLGAGETAFNGVNTYSGGTTVAQGTLNLNEDFTAAGVTMGHATLGDGNSTLNIVTGKALTLNNSGITYVADDGVANVALVDGDGAVTIGANTTFNVADNSGIDAGSPELTINSSFSGDGSDDLLKTGEGTLRITGTNNTGGLNRVRVDGGVVQIEEDDNLGDNAIFLSTGANTGVIEYVGIGGLIDTSIQHRGNASTNATLRANGSGAVEFSLFSNTGAGDTLTLDGSSTALNLISADLDEVAGNSLTKAGTGTWVLGVAQTYTGDTTVTGGTLVLNEADLDDASTVTIDTGAVLQLDHGVTDFVAALTLGGVAQPAGVYGPIGSGETTESALLTGTGTITVGAAPLAALTWDGTTNTTWANPDSDSWTGETYDDGENVQFLDANASPVTISGTVLPGDVLVDSTTDYTISGDAIGGATGLTKSGTSTLTLTGTNTYTGITTISAGTLQLGDGTNGNDGSVAGAIANSGDLTFNVEGTGTYSGDITGNGSLTKIGAGTQTISGALQLGTNQQQFNVTSNGDAAPELTISGGIGANGERDVIKNGTGTLLLTGDNSAGVVVIDGVGDADFDGINRVRIKEGVVQIQQANNLGDNSLFISDGANVGILEFVGSSATTIINEISLRGDAGTNTILRANGTTAADTVEYQYFNDGGAGDTLTLDGANTGLNTISFDLGKLSNGNVGGGLAGGVTKDGAGTWVLGDIDVDSLAVTQTYTGPTTVTGGRLVLSGADLDDASTVTVGTGAVLQLDHSDVDLVATLNFGGVDQAGGVYNAGNSGGFITGTGSIEVASAASDYSTWATTNGVTGGLSGDSDGDGNLNFVEYALDILIDGYEAPGTLTGNTISFSKRAEAVTNGDVLYSIESSEDLGDLDPWTAVTPTSDTTTEITLTFTPGTPDKEFYRLSVVTAP